ncbi:MAG: dockerin type I repeat-containing protein [Oscillospiraceae bacterium]|nr:dockerin type I repeat-containing protein [Oscillospiraceae bacterium]MBQ9111830.1 dockerin type I repeat-containing protein [Oscillospiraceae bacterium]
MNFLKKTAAVLSASAVLAAAAMPVQAADTQVQVAIDQVTVTLEELAEMDYCVPVAVSVTKNPGINAVEFGVVVDDRCTYEIVSEYGEELPDGRSMIATMATSSVESMSWLAWASANLSTRTGVMVCYYVNVPKNAAAGDVYTLDYLEEDYSPHLWSDNVNIIRYVDLGQVSWTDGSITIAGEPSGITKGDVNNDGNVSIADVLALNKNLLAGEPLSEQGALNADADGDGTPSSADALMILQYTLRIISAL